MWEPEENGGVPLLGNPSAAVLYPGKLIYAVLAYPWATRIYIIAHVALAFVAMSILLRGWGVSSSGATLAGLGYAFGGPVLFHYYNVILLVGAAWMPLAFHFAYQWIQIGNRRSLAWLALVLSMQNLGGDPEAAYLSVCAAAAYALGLELTDPPRRGRRLAQVALAILLVYLILLGWTLWGEALGPRFGLNSWPRAGNLASVAWGVVGLILLVRWVRRDQNSGTGARLLGLAAAGGLAIMISAVQLVPGFEFISRSPRATSGRTPAVIYDNSIHPARIIEGLWPNFFGTIAKGNHRWLEALPPTFDYQVWTESLYQGVPILILGLAAAGFRRGPSRQAWLTAITIVGLAGALGTYGSPLFWARSYAPLASVVGQNAISGSEGHGDGQALPSGVGGIYWLMATALPGFSAFRYPGKLLVIASLGLCGLAGLGWDELVLTGSRRSRRIASAGLAFTMAILLFTRTTPGRERLTQFLSLHPDLTTIVYGPLEVPGALTDLNRSLVHSALALIAILLVFRWTSRWPQLAGAGILGVLTLDLAAANAQLIHSVPQAAFDARPKALDMIENAEATEPSKGPYRIHRMPNWTPAAWLYQGAPDRIETILRWERDNLYPKYGITEGVSYTLTQGTADLSDLLPFFDTLFIRLDEETSKAQGFPPGYLVRYYTRRGFDLWNARYFILPARLALGSKFRGVLAFLPHTTEIYPRPGAFDGPDGERLRKAWLRDDDVQILRNDAAYPRAWIVHRARFPAPIGALNSADRLRVMDELLYQDDELWHVEGRKVYDPKAVAWIEVDPSEVTRIARALSGADPDPTESVEFDLYEPQRVELTANLRTPGLVVLADVLYPGWELTIDGAPARVLRTNRVMRGALVPAGTHRLVYSYRPKSLLIGAVLSVVGVAVFIVLLFPFRFRGTGGVAPDLAA